MYSKFFTRLFLLMGMIGMFSVPLRAEEVQIGSGTDQQPWLPSHSYFKYSLTQQIYTAEEIGGVGTINSIAFFNSGSEKTRTYDIYLVNTEKSSFSGSSDWLSVSSNDLVFSGSVTMTENAWTTIHFSSAFDFAGDNLAVVVNDKTGGYSNGMSCLVFTPSGDQGVVSLYASNDGSNYDLSNPGNASGTVTYKNQIILDIDMASVTCAKPKSFNAAGITAHEATLTWQAGAEGQSNWDVYVTTDATIVPDENTTPTYQVTECTKALNSLETQTTYYAFVRSACGGDDGNSKWANTSFTTTREALTIDAENPYTQDFENNNDWTLANGTYVNQWCWGSATNNGGAKALYISDDNGASNNYSHSALVVYASKLFGFAQGTYTFSFDWKANGESSYDFLRVALVPGDKTFTAGGSLLSGVTASTLPDTWIALDGGSKLNQSNDWQTKVTETALSGTYTMVFLWRNDGGGGSQPPAAIDNISISLLTCPRPTNLTASNIAARTAILAWKENGTANGWTLQYATDANFSTNLVEISEGFTVNGSYAGYGLTGLSGETKYYVRVKSNCESSWSDVINFTTTATCVKPTSVTANDITAYSAAIGWTNGEEGQEAWEISYSTTTQSNPENGTVIAANTNPYTLTGLTPETSYYVYVRANCGDEDGMSAWSSYKYFTTLATCIQPTNLTASNVTSSTATITWTAGEADQTAWNLQYKKSSDNEWTSISTDATTCNLENLSPVTTYNVRVQADCGDGDLSQWTSNTNFTTECAELTLPYTCDFEGAVETSPYSSYPMPKCWSRIVYQYGSYSYSYYPYVYDYSSYAHGGSKSLRLYKTSASANETAILPVIDDIYQMKDLQIRFWAKSGSTNQSIMIGVMTSPTDVNTFTKVADVEGISSNYTEFTVTLENYEGDGRYIAIKCGTSSNNIYFYIDDLTVEEIPSCRIPTELDATVNSATETTLTWQAGGDETNWELEVTAEASGISQTIQVNGEPSYLLSTARATTYSVKVRANCGDGDFSDWTDVVTFTSDCGVMPIDATHSFVEDFENVGTSDFPPLCWNKFSHEMSGYTYWYLNSNNGLGSSAAFSYWNEGYAFLVLPKMHINGDATLTFDHLIGSGTYNESCSVVVSTGEMTYNDFNQTIWAADGNNLPSGKTNATVSLSDFNGQDLYVAFKFKGSGTSGCTWYVDNVQVHVGEIFTKDITAYTAGSKDRYYLIASPIGEVSPENVTDMLSNSYDLYRFNQNPTLADGIGLEWENYKAESFNLEPGKGYLYANSQNVTLKFTGVPYSGNSIVTLTKTDDVEWSGWNLVGNPFAQTAYITKTFYTMNDNGSEVIAGTGNSIEVMEGVFVIANQDGEEMTFGTTQPAKQNQQLVVNVTHDRGASTGSATTIDRAIIRFDEGQQLPKFQLNPNSTKVYIPQENKDYAIVSAESNVGELPVNFKAEENGDYTFTFSNEEIAFDYLHLIDNMTGADVDLLALRQAQGPASYTFEARKTDYASRFRLVFSTNGNANGDDDMFAFFSNDKLVVLNEGKAALQVIDVMGRVLYTEQINGNAEVNLNQPAGLYILRLTNGNDVKVQKVVVK
ncbi:MAG: fibronectin type III domain-containing protein [Bacteroidales bacterium]|nr:fibronectin type III domain-containing protein [Bacteroidales bacterium]